MSLSGCRKESRVHHLLEDGAGLVILSLEVQSLSSPELDEDVGVAEAEADDAVWDFMTACLLIEPFHEAAKAALNGKNRDSRIPVTRDFASWAPSILAWLPRQPCPPTGHSICGYRVGISEDVPQQEVNSQVESAYKRVSVYDFTPAHVADAIGQRMRQRSVVSYESIASSSPPKTARSWRIRPLTSEKNLVKAEISSSVERFAVLRSMPSVAPTRLARALEIYVTEAQYIVSSKRIRLSLPDRLSVLHLTQDYLLFAQVCVSSSASPNAMSFDSQSLGCSYCMSLARGISS